MGDYKLGHTTAWKVLCLHMQLGSEYFDRTKHGIIPVNGGARMRGLSGLAARAAGGIVDIDDE